MDNGKVDRTLGIYTRLMGGYIVSKTEEAQRYGVNERTIQRDIDLKWCPHPSDSPAKAIGGIPPVHPFWEFFDAAEWIPSSVSSP